MITDDAVYSDEVEIQAPVELVWQVLTNFADYGKWNPFCPRIKTRLKLGEPVEMMVDLGNGLQEQVEYMARIDAPNAIAWSMTFENRETLYACRTQTLTQVTENSCRYCSVDRFEGKLSAMVLEQTGAAIEKGFNDCAYGLKQFVETMQAAKSKA